MDISGAGDFSLEIDYRNESAGWIKCYITFDGIGHLIYASDVYPPFQSLLNLTLAIATQRLPYAFYWDEEGKGAMISAWPVADDSPSFRLKIWHDLEQAFWVDAELDRMAVVEVILAALRDFVLYAFTPSRGPWGIYLDDIVAFEALYRQPIPQRSNIASAEPVRFVIYRWRQGRWPSLEMYLDILTLSFARCLIHDANPFWPGWFAFLEKIALKQLPAQVEFVDLIWQKSTIEDIAKGYTTEAESWPAQVLEWQAEPLEHDDHFRLKIIQSDHSFVDFLLLDEVLDRRQFVRAFCDEFERMLKNGYRARTDEDGNKFNLRTLPLKRLKKLVA